MESAEVPFVAVIGGLWQFDKATAGTAKAAAKLIGAELAKAGFGLVVYFSNDESLEPHVVSGYTGALADGAGAIRVRYAESQRGQVKFNEEATRPELFDHRLFPGDDWEAPFYRSLTEEEGVDAVLLLGGATSTLIAGQIAVARRLPILAVDQFGGSAAKIWKQIAQATPDKNSYSWGTRAPAAFIAQLKQDCAVIAAQRKEVRRREQLLAAITAQGRKARYAGAAFVVLLAALLLGMVYPPAPSVYAFVMFAALVAAGATGALIRTGIPNSTENNPGWSLLLGSVAGLVVGLAYLIPQWVGAPGILAPNAETVSATDKIQFVSVVLVALSAGVGFDTVFNRLQKQADSVPIGPPK